MLRSGEKAMGLTREVCRHPRANTRANPASGGRVECTVGEGEIGGVRSKGGSHTKM